MSPLLDLKYNDNITEDFKLPPPTRVAVNSGLASEMFPYNINIVPYVDKETFVFLYLDSKTKAVTYDMTNGIHKKIKRSVSPKAMDNQMDKILHIRLGKESLFQEDFLILDISSNYWTKSMSANLLTYCII